MIKWADLKIIFSSEIKKNPSSGKLANLVDFTGVSRGINNELDVFIKQLDSIISREDDEKFKK
jgi:hypothetical protein